MSESITLPRSGVVLPPPSSYQPGVWWLPATAGWICSPDQSIAHPGEWQAQYACEEDTHGTREECIAWLDERVLELRSALLPRDAKQRIFNAVIAQNGTMLLDDELNAVLAALGVDHA